MTVRHPAAPLVTALHGLGGAGSHLFRCCPPGAPTTTAPPSASESTGVAVLAQHACANEPIKTLAQQTFVVGAPTCQHLCKRQQLFPFGEPLTEQRGVNLTAINGATISGILTPLPDSHLWPTWEASSLLLKVQERLPPPSLSWDSLLTGDWKPAIYVILLKHCDFPSTLSDAAELTENPLIVYLSKRIIQMFLFVWRNILQLFGKLSINKKQFLF
ncbi:uncharacterized protein LOC119233739 isoform X2 [Talpa occidentalis]|uniref:uncharacterized protein LOC119233739 isoform X2 n=1 Tax=Talpa occidentalis TaxID=50954 RepID=UPI0023F67899|nr:uncharacterized protein LOC119233739 isoform X2 [Talpa occidentalis]